MSEDRDFYKVIGENLSKYRNVKGITQRELAAHLGLKQSTINDYERGKIRLPFVIALRICSIYKITPNHLLGRKGERKMKRFSVSPGCTANVDELLAEISRLEDKVDELTDNKDGLEESVGELEDENKQLKADLKEAQAAFDEIESLSESINDFARRLK